MRFWITRNSELPIKEQLVRQVVLGILSDDLPAGHRLPSVRALARRHKIHPNTVSAAYHDLLERGWLALRKGSGVYVQPLAPTPGTGGELDGLLATLLRDARGLGVEPEQVLDRLEQMLRPRQFARILIAEPEAAMREILLAEIDGHVRAAAALEAESIDDAAVAALTSRAPAVRKRLPRATPCVALRLNSVRKSLEGETRPSRDTILSIASKSFEFRSWARTMLLAVGLEPDGVCEVDANASGWTERLGASAIVIADLVSARALPSGGRVKVFRVIAEASIEELKQLCPL